MNNLGGQIASGLQATAIGAALGITVGTSPMPDAARDLAQNGTPLAEWVDFSAASRDGAESRAQSFEEGEVDEQVEEAPYGDHSDPDEGPTGDFVGEVDTWDTSESDLDEFENMTGGDVLDDDAR
jgi:hypothetical protein